MIAQKTTLKSRLPAVISGAEANAALAVKKTCERIETRAKARSRVDTGNMRAGWQHEMTGLMEGIVFNLTEYTVYNEFGTIMMAAQPMLTPAIEESKDEFAQEVIDGYNEGVMV
jgi:HK97 gp10 family phage protein